MAAANRIRNRASNKRMIDTHGTNRPGITIWRKGWDSNPRYP
jgi:hypothetical protein